MFDVIVVGTDGSERADGVVQCAIALAEATGATLHAVHVVRLVTMMGESAAAMDTSADLHDEGDRALARVLAAAERRGVVARPHPMEGDPADALVKAAESVDADLVVVGNRGMTGLRGRVLGSVPNTVSHNAPCSVLIVNTEAE